MTLRVSNFKGSRRITTEQRGQSVVATFELPQRATLKDLTQSELRYIIKQCYDILSGQEQLNEVYINNIIKIEEVSNEKVNRNDDSADSDDDY